MHHFMSIMEEHIKVNAVYNTLPYTPTCGIMSLAKTSN